MTNDSTKIKICNHTDGSIIFECEASTLKQAVLLAVSGGVSLSFADLREADLRGCDLCGANLSGCDLRGCDLRRAELRGADLCGCDLCGANISNTDLSEVIGLPACVPVIPEIDRAILAAIEGGGALDMSAFHSCETTHCRAGWAIQLAGTPGRYLETKYGSCVAGALIYDASRPGVKVPDFFASNADALADIRACAAN